jgi:hypothetical protein
MNTDTLRNALPNRESAFGWLFTLLLLLSSPAAFAQLAGTYTINKNQPTAGTNFASFTAAATALNTSGISAPVRFNVLNGPYAEQFVLNSVTGASATDTIVVDGGANKQTIGFTGVTGNLGTVVLNGTDYVTLQNLTIDASAAAIGVGVHLVGSANNNRVRDCVVRGGTGTSTTTAAGIAASGTVASATSVGDASNLRIENNLIEGGYYGVTMTGTSTTARTSGNRVTGNEIRDFYSYGVEVNNTAGVRVLNNNIHRPTRATNGTIYGVYVLGCISASVERNRIHDPLTANPTSTSTVYGMYFTTSDAAAGTENDAVNNLLYNFTGSGTQYGLGTAGSDFVRFYHNTISLDNQTGTGATQTTYGIYQTTIATGVDVRNNVVSVTRAGGTGVKQALYFATATSTITSNYNDLYIGTGATYFTGGFGTVDYASLADWRGANSGVFDQNSLAADPEFVAAATGNLLPTNGALNGTATPLARVTTDFTGAARSATAPDLGAYEFTPAANDVSLESIDSPVAPVVVGARPVTVTIRNSGGSVLNSVTLAYTLNGGTPVTQQFTALNLAGGATRQLTFTTSVTLAVGANTLAVTASLPNGSADANPGNNIQTVTLYTALAGTYTINKNLPTAGTNFASFANAATALNSAGISASVRFNVLNGPYTEQFVLNSVAGVSATDTIVVDGGASKQTISYTGVVSQPAAIQLNGTDYVTLQNLTIDASAGATYGIGVHLVGSANNNRIANCVVMGPATATSSTANAGIAASGTVTSASSVGDANNLRIENNVISGGYYGVILTGASTTARATGLRVTGNEIKNFYFYGLDVESTTGARLLANDIHRTNRTGVTTFYGVYLIGSVGAAIERNRIHDNATAAPGSTSIAYGIYFSAADATAGNENDVVNNAIYNFNGAGTEYGLYNTSSDFARYYHNTVSLDNQTATGVTQTTYGFYQTTLATGIDFRNNVVSVTRTGGTGDKYALYFVTATSTITSNYNDLYVGTGSLYFTGRAAATDYATLANWRTAAAGIYDQNSIAADPRFVSTATGNLEPGNVALNGTGTTATIVRVPRDINNVLRATPPDLGAYEFTPVANDVALVSIDSPATPATPGVNTVTVTIRNGGTATLTSVALSYTLNSGTASAPQTFTGLTLAPGATQQLTFTQGVVAPSGTNTLSVTASLPNGQPDANATNNTLTITFDQPTPDNDEPCTAVALGNGPTTGSNSGASTTVQPTIITPACSPAALPKDVWYTMTPSGTSSTITLTGAPAGMVRVFSAPNCATGPFTQVFCAGSGTANTAVGTVTVTGLTAGTRYYVAVSGYGSADTGGQFTIAATGLVLGTKPQTNSTALIVFPNPSTTGQFTLQVARPLGAGTVELLNALGQVVQRQPLAAGEQTVRTTGLAAGLYTLRVQAGAEVLTRKVVLQ